MLKHIVAISRGILYDRRERRHWMGRFTLVVIGYFAIGLWVLDAWLGQSLIRMALYWLVCTLMALMLVIFALYDVLRTLREERERRDVD